MRKVFLLAVVVCVAMLTVGTGCSNKKVESADSTNTESTEVDSDTVDDVDSATEVIASTRLTNYLMISSSTSLQIRSCNVVVLTSHCQF